MSINHLTPPEALNRLYITPFAYILARATQSHSTAPNTAPSTASAANTLPFDSATTPFSSRSLLNQAQ